MSEGDDDGLTVDDIVTADTFEETVSSLEDSISEIQDAVTGDGGGDGPAPDDDGGTELPDGIVTEDDLPDFDNFAEKDDVSEISRREAIAQARHWVNEDCDTDVCNEIREKFGLDPSGGEGDDHDHDDEDAESADDGDTSDDDSNADDDPADDDGDSGGNDRTPFEVV